MPEPHTPEESEHLGYGGLRVHGVRAAVAVLADVLKNAVTDIRNVLKDAITDNRNVLKDARTDIRDVLKDAMTDNREVLKDAITGNRDVLKDAITDNKEIEHSRRWSPFRGQRGGGESPKMRCLRMHQKLTKGLKERFLIRQNKTGCEFSRKSSFLKLRTCLLYTSPSPRDFCRSRMPSSA